MGSLGGEHKYLSYVLFNRHHFYGLEQVITAMTVAVMFVYRHAGQFGRLIAKGIEGCATNDHAITFIYDKVGDFLL